MQLHKFVARDAKSGLEQIRQKLGADAVVVTSRKIAGGIEIMAGRYTDLDASDPGATVTPSRQIDSANASHTIWRELTRLRALLQNQLAGLTWSSEKRRNPARIHVMQKMLAAGFGPALARHVAAGLPKTHSISQAEAWLRQILIRNLRTFASSEWPDHVSGAWALVGPTGHGKTTTLAKLAARAVLQHGADKVALISLDTYRIGAQQQMDAYARMMGIKLLALEEIGQLGNALHRLSDKHCILIDSAGFAPQDKRFVEQVSVLRHNAVKCLLTIAASSQGSLAERLIQRCQPDGVILTKLDEGGLHGAVLDSCMRYRVPLACMATGQQVPEDLHAVNITYLVDRVLRTREEDAFALREDDWPVQLGAEAEYAEYETSSADMGHRRG